MKKALLALLSIAGLAAAQQFVQIPGAPCIAPPTLHCPDKDCSTDRIINQGPVVEMKTRRTYFLDYPCDLKKDEKVTFILALHGAGSYGNWQRHYFPLIDYKDRYRLVIATPNSPTHVWSSVDDEYLQNIVNFVIDQIGTQNVKAFWLVGHSQGGMTSNRIVRTDFFKDKVDGWLSLSGGRLGGNPGRAASFGAGRPVTPGAAAMPATGATTTTNTSTTTSGTAAASTPTSGARTVPSGASAAVAALRELPGSDFSHIYETGEREIDEKGIPEVSEWAAKYNCGARRKPEE